MDVYGGQVNKLIAELSGLPGIGGKTAQRLAFYIINMPEDRAKNLADAIVDAKTNIKYCKTCYTITDREECPICASEKRNHKLIMVVESPRDLAAYERTARYDGVYHVLHGVINPALGIGVGDIKLKELIVRLEQQDVEELIIATNSSVEGEATAMYISKLLKPSGIKTTRIASGVPVGGDLECIDEVTLLRALEGRITI
ncbi:MAG: recombination mediator RecR [Clostridium sp.]|nr:recombination mediator RecR [Clostridium sp.]MCM1398623.1 recombination mediator RecR [Clostridium sp.]MCM1459910.1 recombination mediator RecR [Bacteroides sp.]